MMTRQAGVWPDIGGTKAATCAVTSVARWSRSSEDTPRRYTKPPRGSAICERDTLPRMARGVRSSRALRRWTRAALVLAGAIVPAATAAAIQPGCGSVEVAADAGDDATTDAD